MISQPLSKFKAQFSKKKTGSCSLRQHCTEPGIRPSCCDSRNVSVSAPPSLLTLETVRQYGQEGDHSPGLQAFQHHQHRPDSAAPSQDHQGCHSQDG